jgi:hypothetical protein
MSKIILKINLVGEDGSEPPSGLIEHASTRFRLWLHEQGLEGDLTIDGQNISIELLQPEGWEQEAVHKFGVRAVEYLQSFGDLADPF